MINSPLLPLAYDNRRVEPLIERGGWTVVNNSTLLPVVYDKRIVEPPILGWTVVNNSPLLLSANDSRIVKHLIVERGVDWGE